MSNTIAEQLSRPARTGGQMSASEVTVQLVEAFGPTLTTAQHVALFGALTLVYGFIQVLVENKIGVAFLRNLPAKAEEVVSVDPVKTEPELLPGPVERTDNGPRDVDPDEQVSQDPSVAYGEEPS